MRPRTAIAIAITGALLLAGAGVSAWKSGPDPVTVCTRGADKFIMCVEQTSRSAADMSRAQRDEGIPACAADPLTVQMYLECNQHASCDAFMKCVIKGAKGE